MLEVPQLNQTGKDLLAATDLLSKGWCQLFSRFGGEVCAARALYEVIGSDDCKRYYVACEAILHHVNSLGKIKWQRLQHWNDTKGRTLDEVLTVFREVAYNQRVEK